MAAKDVYFGTDARDKMLRGDITAKGCLGRLEHTTIARLRPCDNYEPECLNAI